MSGPRTMAAERLLSADVTGEDLDEQGGSVALLATARVLTGPIDRAVTQIGLWQVEPGTDVDVEVEEVFVVLTGLGTITFDDASRIDLRPGSLVHLRTGDRTVWVIAERLRKLYLLMEPDEEGLDRACR